MINLGAELTRIFGLGDQIVGSISVHADSNGYTAHVAIIPSDQQLHEVVEVMKHFKLIEIAEETAAVAEVPPVPKT